MIGGFKKTASVFAIAAAAGVLSTSAFAADLGGNCCADLEERVAELEATTVRKGNRKVSLTISGHVNEAITFWDDGFESNAYVATNMHSRTRIRFRGSAKINSDWSAGFYMEFGYTRPGHTIKFNQDGNPAGADDIRQQALYIDSKSLGRLWLGHTGDATYLIETICLGCPTTDAPESSLGWGAMRPYFSTGDFYLDGSMRTFNIGTVPGTGSRRDVIKYVSPAFAGFTVSASWGGDDHWDVALRYANEFNGIRVAGGIGYSEDTENMPTGTELERLAGSFSVQHVPTGLFAMISGGYLDDTSIAVGEESRDEFWFVTAGVITRITPLGKTTFWGSYGDHQGSYLGTVGWFPTSGAAGGTVTVLSTEGTVWNLGINQKIDAAAMELYLTYSNVEMDVNTTGGTLEADTLSVVQIGARIKF